MTLVNEHFMTQSKRNYNNENEKYDGYEVL